MLYICISKTKYPKHTSYNSIIFIANGYMYMYVRKNPDPTATYIPQLILSSASM